MWYTYIIIAILLIIAELVYFRIADKCNIIDKPNERSSRSTIVLRGGGVIFTIADIESVVVSSKCRGCGYGKELMTAMIEAARKMSVHHIHLSSNPARVAANQLYQELGFERYETNCYKMILTI